MQVQEAHQVTWKDKGFGFPVMIRADVTPPAELSRIIFVLHTLSSTVQWLLVSSALSPSLCFQSFQRRLSSLVLTSNDFACLTRSRESLKKKSLKKGLRSPLNFSIFSNVIPSLAIGLTHCCRGPALTPKHSWTLCVQKYQSFYAPHSHFPRSFIMDQ